MQALLRLDEMTPPRGNVSPINPAAALLSCRGITDAAAAAAHLGMGPPAMALSVDELHERIVSTLARASNRPHSAWRSRLRIMPRVSGSDGAWELVATDPVATALLSRAAELVKPFFPLVRG